MASIRDVAKMAGVSVGTVSRYLNGQQLKEKNMKKIAEAISALDYKENIIAKGLKNNRSFFYWTFDKRDFQPFWVGSCLRDRKSS